MDLRVCRASRSCISREAPGARSVLSPPRSSTSDVNRSRNSGNCPSIMAASVEKETEANAGRIRPRHNNSPARAIPLQSSPQRRVLFRSSRASRTRPQPRNRQSPSTSRPVPRRKARSRICRSRTSNCCSICGGIPRGTADMIPPARIRRRPNKKRPFRESMNSI